MTTGWRELFDRSGTHASGGGAMRLTERGIWLPLPLDVLEAAGRALAELPGEGGWILDAGMGDGRLVASAARATAAPACGIECDPGLFESAQHNLRALHARGEIEACPVAHGDYLDPEVYRDLGFEPSDVRLFASYADGGEQQLADFVAAEARPGARLALLTADQSLRVEGLGPATWHRIERGAGAPAFLMSVYRHQGP